MREKGVSGTIIGITIDGVGEKTTSAKFEATIKLEKVSNLKKIEIMKYPASIGLFYSAITSFLGFEVNDAEFKVMGLAAYGKEVYANEMTKMLNITEEGTIGETQEYFDYSPNSIYPYKGKVIEKLGPPSKCSKEYAEEFTTIENVEANEKLGRYANIAASAQKVITEVVEKIFFKNNDGEKTIYYGGGVALLKTNMKIMDNCRLKLTPDPGDGGSALGAAVIGYMRTGEKLPILTNAYLGYDIHDDDSYGIVNEYKDLSLEVLSEERIVKRAADDLANGNVIGWCQGKAEFGPRALGNRSILANPKDRQVQLKVNTAIKFREPFRPFAPAILEKEAEKYFEVKVNHAEYNSPYHYMLSVCNAKKLAKERIPACIHVDGTSRVQIVNSQKNKLFNELIEKFYVETGIPVLLNTSFNLRGEPIVNNTVDAIETFRRSNMDSLYVGNIKIKRLQ